MFQIEGIKLYLCISQVIYRSLNIEAVNISINQNIIGLVGKNDTHLTCTFTIDTNLNFINVAIVARKKNEIFLINKPVAVFPPDKKAILLPSGGNLSGRVKLTNITKLSTTATLRFDNLKCEDEKDYICTFNYVNDLGVITSDESEPSKIFIKAFPLMPESISYVVIALIRKAKQDNSSAGFTNNTNNILFSTKQNDNSSFYTLLADTVTSTPLKSTEKPVSSFREGDIIQFTCTGNIGKPPGKFIWQIIPQQGKPKIYSNETTTFELIPNVCSYRGTSNLTVEISADHFKAKIRCYEESQADVLGKFVETEPIDVFYTVREPNITKQPNQKQYDKKTPTIALTCKGDGNPQPHYKWFRQENTRTILSSTNFYIIEDVVQNNSGVYICEVYNTIDDIEYNANITVNIDIVDKLSSSTESESLKISAVNVVLIICAVVIGAFVVALVVRKFHCNRHNEKTKEQNCCQKQMDFFRNWCGSNVISTTDNNVPLTELKGTSDVKLESKSNCRSRNIDENRGQYLDDSFMSCHGITCNPEYTSIIFKNNSVKLGALEDNTITENKINEGSTGEDKNQMTTVDINPQLETDSIYADPSDAVNQSAKTDLDISYTA